MRLCTYALCACACVCVWKMEVNSATASGAVNLHFFRQCLLETRERTHQLVRDSPFGDYRDARECRTPGFCVRTKSWPQVLIFLWQTLYWWSHYQPHLISCNENNALVLLNYTLFSNLSVNFTNCFFLSHLRFILSFYILCGICVLNFIGFPRQTTIASLQ